MFPQLGQFPVDPPQVFDLIAKKMILEIIDQDRRHKQPASKQNDPMAVAIIEKTAQYRDHRQITAQIDPVYKRTVTKHTPDLLLQIGFVFDFLQPIKAQSGTGHRGC